MLETQRQLIEKDAQVINLLQMHRDKLFKVPSGGDYALDLLLKTSDALNQECVALREQVWRHEIGQKQMKTDLEAKSGKI